MIPTRSATALAGVAVLLVSLMACGGKADQPVPDARAAVGGYRLTTTITRSSVTGTPTGSSSALDTVLFLSCADRSCTALDQRVLSTGSPQGNTIRLTPGPGGFTGQHIRSGTCEEGTGGAYGESFAWTWRHRSDGSLEGTLKQVFKGCGLDGTTTYRAVATPAPELRLPYLDTTRAAAWIRDVNAYDAELGRVYVSGTECNTVANTTTVAEAACFARTYAAWRPDIDRLAARTAPVAAQATGACRDSLHAIDFARWSRLVGAAATTYRAARDKAGVRAGVNAEKTATSFATAQHDRLVTALAMCTDPALAPSLGVKGTLELDVDSVLQPLDE